MNATVKTNSIAALDLPAGISLVDAFSMACSIVLQMVEPAYLAVDGAVIATVTVEQARAHRVAGLAREVEARKVAEERRRHRDSGCPGCPGCR